MLVLRITAAYSDSFHNQSNNLPTYLYSAEVDIYTCIEIFS